MFCFGLVPVFKAAQTLGSVPFLESVPPMWCFKEVTVVLVRAAFDCVLLCEQEGLLLHLEEPLGSSSHCHYHWCHQKPWNKMRKFSFFINIGQGNKQGSKEKSLAGKLTRGRSYLCSLARVGFKYWCEVRIPKPKPNQTQTRYYDSEWWLFYLS